jgi:hypothetical protein
MQRNLLTYNGQLEQSAFPNFPNQTTTHTTATKNQIKSQIKKATQTKVPHPAKKTVLFFYQTKNKKQNLK